MTIKKEYRAPADFEPSPTHWGKAEQYDIDLIFQLMRFKEHVFNKNHKDWNKAFHNWLNNCIEWRLEREKNYATSKLSTHNNKEELARKHYQSDSF